MKSSMHFFGSYQSHPQDSSLNARGNEIFFEFNPYKTVPCRPLPNYHLNRLTKPPEYVRLITQSPDLQQHLIQKVISLVNSMLEHCQTLGESPEEVIQQEALNIKKKAESFLRQIERDLSRPPGFEMMTGEVIKSIIEQAMIWKKDVLAWIEEVQQADSKLKQVLPKRRTVSPIEASQAAVTGVESKESWSPAIRAAAKNLQLAVARREAEKLNSSMSQLP